MYYAVNTCQVMTLHCYGRCEYFTHTITNVSSALNYAGWMSAEAVSGCPCGLSVTFLSLEITSFDHQSYLHQQQALLLAIRLVWMSLDDSW